MANFPSAPSRRAVTKSAAWAAPVILAAVAAPAASASPVPVCPTCFRAGPVGAYTSQALVVGNRGTIAFGSIFNIDSTLCDLSLFSPTYSILTTSATLTMSDGRTYTQTLNLGAGQGSFGAVSGVGEALVFSNVLIPDGGSIFSPAVVRPVKICISFIFILEGLPFLIKIECPQTLCWSMNSLATGIVVGGLGTVNYSGTFSPLP